MTKHRKKKRKSNHKMKLFKHRVERFLQAVVPIKFASYRVCVDLNGHIKAGEMILENDLFKREIQGD